MTRHNAPPVIYPLERSRFVGFLLFGLWLAGLLGVVCWGYALQTLNWRLTLAVMAVGVSGVAAWKKWKNSPTGHLAWDGQRWSWVQGRLAPHDQKDATAYTLAAIVDLQHKLLLRLESANHTHTWLWAERTTQPERWLDLRRAVYLPGRIGPSFYSTSLAESLPSVAVSGHAEPQTPRIKP